MEPLSEAQIRSSFVNATKGEAKRVRVPSDLGDRDWESLDYFGWVDPRAPLQAYLVAPVDGGLVGVQLRRNQAGSAKARMCSICLTTQSGTGVSLLVAPRTGKAGRDGNSVGIDLCTDLLCSHYVRGLLSPAVMAHARETISVEERVARLERNLAVFVRRVSGDSD